MSFLTYRGRPWKLFRTLTSIGSDADNDIVVDERGVAPTHAHIRIEDGQFILVALDAKARPVYVDGRSIKRQPLSHQSELRLGEALIQFSLWDEKTTLEQEVVSGSAGDELRAYRRLATFSLRLGERLTVDAMLEALMDEVIALTGADKGFLLMMRDGHRDVRTARNLNRETMAATLNQMSDSIIAQVIATREPIIVSDALNDTQFNASASVMQLQLLSVMCAPLLFKGELLGLIYVGNNNIVSQFEPRSLELLTVFASQAALLLEHALRFEALKADNVQLRCALDAHRFGLLIGACDAMREVYRRIDKIAPTDVNVLLRGATGTGKELAAREIHLRSGRKDAPFVAINCAAIPESLMESELFGHRRGAFSGAIENKLGCFQAANGGTLFLDEIGEMAPSLQVKLLRAIQEKVVRPVGDTKSVPVDIRVVAATHVNLEEAIKTGRFREDLYYRLNVISLELPALRERDEDVVLIARFLLEKYAKELGRPIRGFTKEAIIALRKHAWPGNIRELENRLKKAIVLADTDELSPADLDLHGELVVDRILPLAEAKEAFQRRYIDQVLLLNNGNRTQTAKDLGVDPRTVFRHLALTRDDVGEGD